MTQALSADEIERCIRQRRSIKPSEFSDQPVLDEVVQRMLEAANWAPTHGRTEPWRFFVFTADARRQLGDHLARFYQEMMDAAAKPSKADKLRMNADRSSHVIVIAMSRQKCGKIPRIEEVEAVACAVQNLHLMATACGVAGYWSSGTAICNDLMKNHLGLDEEDQVLGIFYVGYPNGDWPEGKRGPAEEKVRWFR